MPICQKCESHNVVCTAKYDTDGASMEYYTWTHTCRDCKHLEVKETHSCYGMDTGEETCALGCGRKYNSDIDQERRAKLIKILNGLRGGQFHSTDPETLCDSDFKKFNYGPEKGAWSKIVDLQNKLRMLCRKAHEPWAQ